MDYVEALVNDDHGGKSQLTFAVAESGDVFISAYDPIDGAVVHLNLRPMSGGGRYPDLCAAIATEVRKIAAATQESQRLTGEHE